MTSTPTVRFLFDLGSPNAYMAHRVIPSVQGRTGATFEYVPILLGGLYKLTGNRSPAEAYAGVANKLEYERKEFARFAREHGIEAYRPNPHFPINTLQIMRSAVAAQVEGCMDRYVEAVFRGMWEQSLKMDDPAILARVLKDAGLDASKLFERSQTPEVKAQLVANTQQAFEAGAFGSPSFLVGSELFFGKDRIRDVEAAIVSHKAP